LTKLLGPNLRLKPCFCSVMTLDRDDDAAAPVAAPPPAQLPSEFEQKITKFLMRELPDSCIIKGVVRRNFFSRCLCAFVTLAPPPPPLSGLFGHGRRHGVFIWRLHEQHGDAAVCEPKLPPFEKNVTIGPGMITAGQCSRSRKISERNTSRRAFQWLRTSP
jgi:hypothetical protein